MITNINAVILDSTSLPTSLSLGFSKGHLLSSFIQTPGLPPSTHKMFHAAIILCTPINYQVIWTKFTRQETTSANQVKCFLAPSYNECFFLRRYIFFLDNFRYYRLLVFWSQYSYTIGVNTHRLYWLDVHRL